MAPQSWPLCSLDHDNDTQWEDHFQDLDNMFGKFLDPEHLTSAFTHWASLKSLYEQAKQPTAFSKVSHF
jgi:hypothetical protein